MLITVVAMAIVLAFAGNVIAGRLAGLSVTALCGATMAFFLMPPILSFRVSETRDIVALTFYGATGLVLAKTRRPKQKVTRIDAVCDVTPRKRLETDLARAVADLMASDMGLCLGADDLTAVGKGFTWPCTHEKTLRMLSDVLTAAAQTPQVQRVSIYGGQRAGNPRLIVAAHYVWPAPLNTVITIGKRDEDCDPVTFPGWPLHSRASCLDNGYDRIYQISFEAEE